MSLLCRHRETGGKDNVRLGDGPHSITTISDLHSEKVKSATRFSQSKWTSDYFRREEFVEFVPAFESVRAEQARLVVSYFQVDVPSTPLRRKSQGDSG